MKSRHPLYNIPERFLRQLWKNQQFSSLNLRTTDSRSIEIISAGKANSDSGPDFTDASVRIGEVLYRGDVEIHKCNEEWVKHQHDKDPKYNSVILHIIFSGKSSLPLPLTQSNRTIPILALDHFLVSTFRKAWENMILDERAERLMTLKCFSKNSNVEPSVIQKWLNKLAIERIELKIRRFEEQLRELIDEDRLRVKEQPPPYGDVPFGINPEELPPPFHKYSLADFRKTDYWEQLLYGGVMEALGYSKNQGPFLKLSRSVRVKDFHNIINNYPTEQKLPGIESILFGVAGLLPNPKKIMDNESKTYLRLLRSLWNKHCPTYTQPRLHESEWQFFRLRPDNFPTVRIAGISRLIEKFHLHSLFKFIIQTLKNEAPEVKKKYFSLQDYFIVPADGFWKSHYRFGEQANKNITTLIGKNRSADIILNVIIPICLLYARIFKDREIRQTVLKIFEQSPPSGKNTITKMVEQQIIKGKFGFQSSMLEQGAIQLYKFFCAEERCSDCAIDKSIIGSSQR